MIILGLTGSIGMGKTTTAQMFRDAGIPVHDADAAVHELYAGSAAALIETAFPGTVNNGVVDRASLGKKVIGNREEMKRLEAIIHPLVAQMRDRFLQEAAASGAKLAVLDIPLLYETGGEKYCDHVVVVTASEEIQRARVLARPEMTEDKFQAILEKQVPDAEKRKRADFIIDTGQGLDAARRQVAAIIKQLVGR
ncbi:dephospho-CoA kinase [Salaquimonas pukyongi]|uniref:dephospho-CoA kinase n=1 Tax=Salaquimonas pukyongi TaxID=2712698 RepID=UPI00096BD089|nr:dephospho-CoA kinase [Salaquimonas pukyongi]